MSTWFTSQMTEPNSRNNKLMKYPKNSWRVDKEISRSKRMNSSSKNASNKMKPKRLMKTRTLLLEIFLSPWKLIQLVYYSFKLTIKGRRKIWQKKSSSLNYCKRSSRNSKNTTINWKGKLKNRWDRKRRSVDRKRRRLDRKRRRLDRKRKQTNK